MGSFMRFIGIAIVSIIAGIGGGLLAYALTQPSFDEVARVYADTHNQGLEFAIRQERDRAEERSFLLAWGVGFLACSSTAVALSFLTTIVDYNLRHRQGEAPRSGAGP